MGFAFHIEHAPLLPTNRRFDIEAPRITVKTHSPTQWSVATRTRGESEYARKMMDDDGLSCGLIRDKGQSYSFTVNLTPNQISGTQTQVAAASCD